MSLSVGFRGRLFGASLLSALVVGACDQKQPESGSEGGVVVERVEAGYGAARAGLLPNDILVAWRGQGGATESEWTTLDSPMDLAVAELEGGQVDSVVLQVRRGDEILSVVVPPAPWRISARPSSSGDEELRLQSGRRHLAEGQIDERLEQWQGLDVAAEPAVEVWLSIARARELIEAERGGEAEPCITAALQAAETAADPDLYAWTWLAVGDLRYETKDYAGAVDAHTRGLEVAAVRWPLAARLRRRLGDSLFRTSDHSGAADEYTKVRAVWAERGVEGSEYIAATLGLGKAERNHSRFDAAATRFVEAMKVARDLSPDHPQLAFGLQEAGTLAYWQSDLPLAEDQYQKAAAIFGELGINDQNLAYLHMGLGGVFLERGELTAAESSYSKARSIFEQTSPGSLLVAWSLRGLGGVAQVRNGLALARRRYGEALRILDPLTVHTMDRAMVLDEVGTVAHEQGDLDAARQAIRESLEILERDHPHSMFPPRHRTDLAAVLLELGETEPARNHLAQALAEWEELLPGSLDHAKTHHQMGELGYQSDDLDSARIHHRAALAIRSRLAPRSWIEAASHYALGRVARAAGDVDEALNHLEQALGSIEAQLGNLGVSEVSRARFRQRQADAYKETIALLLELGDPEGAFDVLERYRAQRSRELLDIQPINLQHTGRPELQQRRDRLVQEYEATWRKLTNANPGPAGRAEVERLRGRLAELEQERQIVREQMRAVDPGLAAADPVPARWMDLQHSLDPETAILSYSVGRDSSWLFAGFGGGLRVLRLEVGEKELSKLVDRFRILLAGEGPGGAGRVAMTRYSHDLYRLLIAPVQGWLAAAEELVVMPDGPLHRLPFTALVQDRVSGEYLVEWKPVSMRASLARTVRRPSTPDAHQPARDRGHQILALGGVSGASVWTRTAAAGETDSGSPLQMVWPDLPFARAELDALQDLFGAEAEIRTAAAASEDAVKRRATDFRYLHLATHARLDSAMPLDSFLLLSASESGSAGSEDGVLRAWEVIEEMELDADVVTLSACESGLGEEFAGYGLLGLTRAFQLAGARSVVASLWQVNDRSTSALMVRFYRGLLNDLAPSEALRQAQLDLLRGEVTIPGRSPSTFDRLRTRLASPVGDPVREERKDDYSHPHHWAAFQVYGAGGVSQ